MDLKGDLNMNTYKKHITGQLLKDLAKNSESLVIRFFDNGYQTLEFITDSHIKEITIDAEIDQKPAFLKGTNFVASDHLGLKYPSNLLTLVNLCGKNDLISFAAIDNSWESLKEQGIREIEIQATILKHKKDGRTISGFNRISIMRELVRV